MQACMTRIFVYEVFARQIIVLNYPYVLSTAQLFDRYGCEILIRIRFKGNNQPYIKLR